MSDANRRKYKRVPTYLMANLKKTNTQESQVTEEMIISNISHGGVFIETNIQFEIGGLISFDMFLPTNRHKLQIVGVVKWRNPSEPYGIGVEFVKVATEDHGKIVKYIEQHQPPIQ